MSRARELRKEMTPAEKALWILLRNRRLRGWKFRRQAAISIYIADFYCHEIRLVVELDGEVHDDSRQAAHDENRDFYLRFLGHEVLRFTNQQVFEEPAAVLDRIAEVSAEQQAPFRPVLIPANRPSYVPPLPAGGGWEMGEGARG